jgi:hemimethylated DNA binding protein
MSKKLSIALYRSFLRWNRNPTVIRSTFNIDPLVIGIPDSHLNSHPTLLKKNGKIKNATGVYTAINYCFRTQLPTSDNIDIAFTVLKNLNELTFELQQNLYKHNNNKIKDVLEKVVFKIGEVVQHNGSGYRGVVVDWVINDVGKQKVTLLLDSLDVNELLGGIYPTDLTFDSTVLSHVTDDSLLRIFNESMPSYFSEGFDEFSKRFIPNEELLFQFPKDFENLLDNNETKIKVNESCNRLLSSLSNIGEDLVNVLNRHNIENSNSIDNINDNRHQEIIKLVLNDVIQNIKSLENINSIDNNEINNNNNNNNNHITKLMYREKISSTIKSLQLLTTCYNSVDQLLQLRFQDKGITYFEGLSPKYSTSKSSVIINPNDILDTYPELDALENVHSYPIASFKVGQVCRHKIYGYRCIVTGWDQRPLVDVSKWEAIIETAHGKEQPFYRVIPDERDIEDLLGSGQFRSQKYVAQDNLVDVTDPSDKVLKHRFIPYFFNGFNAYEGIYNIPHKLRFCFPSPDHSLLPSESNDAATYLQIEFFLLDIYFTIKKSLNETRIDHSKLNKSQIDNITSDNKAIGKVSMNELLTILKHVCRRNEAVNLESLIWLIWMSHDDPQVSKLMRIGVSEMSRGNFRAAFDAFLLAANKDPEFAEANNKLAALHHKINEHEQCAHRATLALNIFPEHYGALAGMFNIYIYIFGCIVIILLLLLLL